ncbi:MAG: M20/M25/M40 family metallo-hydrolase [Myxococcales bacterium]|nr:M20/M25/M40 family metallo-hydrolase [Myxococcales bacterium]
MTAAPNSQRLQTDVDLAWDSSIVPALQHYIAIPAESPAFDPTWEANGYIDAAVDFARAWAEERGLDGATLEVLRLPGRTPVLLLERPGEREGTILLYGHLDKQPPFTGWRDGLGPWKPVLTDDGKLYGRGGADDGYAIFASVAALQALRAQGLPLPRIVVLIEASEESGSPDLPAHLDAIGDRLGSPDLVICLDSGAGDFDRLWMTTSLRGLVGGTLSVRVLENGVHSGDASGVVASSFRIARALLDRIEDAETGRLKPEAFHVPIPPSRMDDAARAGGVLGAGVWTKYRFAGGTGPVKADSTEMILNRTWRPALSVVGADGLPPTATAGNVLRPMTSLKLSLRVPPTVDAGAAGRALGAILTESPPYGADVTWEPERAAGGWNAPELSGWLSEAISRASETYFGRPSAAIGEGGSIPFMGMLGERFPKAQFLITGVLGPETNAHGPNEFLHVPYAKKLTAAVADVVAAFRPD